MEIGIIIILAIMLVVSPVAITISKTPSFRNLEDKFFEDHDHYM